MKYFKIFFILLLFLILTLLTQIGGITLLLSLGLYNTINKKTPNLKFRVFLKILSFLVVYSFATFIVVPVLAKAFGRVPLPITETNHLKPLNILTCLLNRHYVREDLKLAISNTAKNMNAAFPGTTVNYLEANFPFFNQYPLWPHLSHKDGKKLDLSFCYLDAKSKRATNNCPSFLGYGVNEEPLPNEVNTSLYCEKMGYWQYSFLCKFVSQSNKSKYILDNARTAYLVDLLSQENKIQKIFIEPHLKVRLGLKSDKVRFHGCAAVRHDDHIHVEIR